MFHGSLHRLLMFSPLQLHINWAATLIGLLAALFAPCPFLFYKYGARIREKSRFAPCIVRLSFFTPSYVYIHDALQDLKIAKELEEERIAEKGGKAMEI